MPCKSCNKKVNKILIDLGSAPLSNNLLNKVDESEKWYPLKVMICDKCWLAQVSHNLSSSEVFNKDYPYFSSVSKSLLLNSKKYVEEVSNKFLKNKKNNKVLEVASNDGYLLQYFKNKKFVSKIIGIEPTPEAAKISRKKKIKTLEVFFEKEEAKKIDKKFGKFDLIIANNVVAHIPNINSFIEGIKKLLSKNGIATIEFQYLVDLIKKNIFDNIYHEHYYYYSFTSFNKILERFNLKAFNYDKIEAQGGSLRIYITHKNNKKQKVSPKINKIKNTEIKIGIKKLKFYKNLFTDAISKKNQFLLKLIELKKRKKTIFGYGAAAKGNTMINFCGIKNDLIDYVVDKNLYKQGKFLPGSRIPIVSESFIKKKKPEYIVIIPWNIAEEIKKDLNYVKGWGCKFIVYQPQVKII